MLRPLKLKVQRVAQPIGPNASDLPIASIWVDSGIPALSEAFSYLIPEKFSSQIQIGTRVQVPFRERQLEGLVIARSEKDGQAGELKAVSKVLGEFPVATAETIELIKETSRLWGGTPYDVIRSAIPPRVATIEKDFVKSQPVKFQRRSTGTTFHLLPPKKEPLVALIELILESKSTGAKLLLVPTARDLERVASLLQSRQIDYLALDSNSARADRYRNFLLAAQGNADLVIGMRSAIFAPIFNLTEIYLHLENSEHYFERRSPYWNARAVAFLRQKTGEISLHLTGYLPSLEVALAIERKSIKYEARRERVAIIAQPSSAGELIPSKLFSEIRNSLKSGPVLFLVPAKGYATAISCAKCRNLAICDCGGKLSKSSANSEPVCIICSKKYLNWKCGWCGENRIFLASRGIERFAEEIGRSFPNYRVVQSTVNQPIAQVGSDPALIISTAGVEPIAADGYRAVVILQIDRFLAATSTSAAEQAYSNFFAASALLSFSGTVALVIEDGSPISSAIATWNPATIAKREIEHRQQLRLPPISSAVVLTGEAAELSRLKRPLQVAVEEGRAPSSLRIYGPVESSLQQFRLTLLVDPDQQIPLVALLQEMNRRRSISKKAQISFQVTPFALD